MHVVFINTGVQIVCEPLKTRVKAAVGHGWQRCECLAPDGSPLEHRYIQWQLRGDRLLFAVDTTCGNPEKGFFFREDALQENFKVTISQLLDRDRKPIANLPRVEIVISPATSGAGDAIAVDLVVDFGNSRTGALLIEEQPEGRMPRMIPFELINRHQLDMWDEEGHYRHQWSARWFSSRTQWCRAPYLPPPEQTIKVYGQPPPPQRGIFTKSKQPVPVEEHQIIPRLFQDLSAVRMGQEVDDVRQAMQVETDARMGVSSPKRYLWASDPSWLTGGLWKMADPTDRDGNQTYSAMLHGPFFRFVGDNDPDEVKLPQGKPDEVSEAEIPREHPGRPQHPPRVLMVAALYEILCQAYGYLNSFAYRESAGEMGRPRELRSLVLTFPSGMIPQERQRFQLQASKAVDIFHATLGRAQLEKPSVMMQIDEATAVHLTYIWSEFQMLERNAQLWFSLVGRSSGGAAAAQSRDVRIGCVDIGGGTSDLMIAKYSLRAGAVDAISGEMLHRDGISLAGDQLMKRLLERIIVPALAETVGMSPDVVEFLFGQEVPANSKYRQQRVQWMNRLFVPLAQAYLHLAVNDDSQTAISHLDPEYVSPEIVRSLQQVIDEKYGGGNINLLQDTELKFDAEVFEDIVYEVFNELFLDFCGRLVKYDADIVLLAGQPTKLRQIQELLKRYLPLHASRVIPVHNYFAGTWYPYQDDEGRNPGVIVDPKSAVVVGGAIDRLISEGALGHISFQTSGIETKDPTNGNDYYWGILTDGTSKIQTQKILFGPAADGQKAQRVERKEFEVVAERVLIGRRLSPHEHAEASPVWCLKVDKRRRTGPIDLKITLERKRATKDQPETLELKDATGTVAGEPACIEEGPDRNITLSWRTLTSDSFYLDTGALDNINLSMRG